MTNDYNKFKRADKKGYLIVPRKLLETMFFGSTETERTEAGMYVYFLYAACYADMEMDHDTGSLERGELLYSVNELSTRFGLNYRTVTRFIQRLEQEKVIGLSSGKNSRQRRMKLLYYDNLCRFTDSTPGGKVRTRKADWDFVEFWDRYHSMSGLPEVEIEEARSQWNRLTAQERRLATENVGAYVCRQRYDRLRTAANYLAHKSFYVE